MVGAPPTGGRARAEALRDLARAVPGSAAGERLLSRAEAALARSPAPYLARMAEEAERKAAQAAEDRERKRRPYEADPLFTYLWRRSYGTAAYRAGPLARYLDRKVARLVGYEAARANYALLIALPDRLAEHAARLRAEASGGGDVLADDPDAEILLREAEAVGDPALAPLIARARSHVPA